MDQFEDSLYSPDLAERLEATRGYDSSKGNPSGLNLVPGCRGAANAFVVLVGSSPGKPAAGELLLSREDQRTNWKYPLTIGVTAGVSLHPFGSGTDARLGWGKLLTAGFGHQEPDQQAINALTGIWNLDWCHENRETGTGTDALKKGANRILELSASVKPRVILTLTKKVNALIWCEIQDARLCCESFGPPIEKTQPILVWFPAVQFPTLVLQSIRHPSYNTLNAPRLALLTNCVSTFLKSR